MQPEDGSEFYATSGLIASFFCGYVASLYLLFHFRANGPAFKPGELRRLLVSGDSVTMYRWHHGFLSDDAFMGFLEILFSVISVIWFFAFTQKKLYALFILGLWFKQVVFCSTLTGLDLSPFALPDDNKLPQSFLRRSSQQIFARLTNVAHGEISLVLVRVYLTAALHVILFFYFETELDISDPITVVGLPGSALRSAAHVLELTGVLAATDRLARILAATEFLRFFVVSTALYRLALFTVFSVLGSVLLLDALGLHHDSLAPVWTFAFPLSLSLARVVPDNPTKTTLGLLALASAAARLLPRCLANFFSCVYPLQTKGTTRIQTKWQKLYEQEKKTSSARTLRDIENPFATHEQCKPRTDHKITFVCSGVFSVRI